YLFHTPTRARCSPFFFFLMIPPQRRSTLFPYTTLFRSPHGKLVATRSQSSRAAVAPTRYRARQPRQFSRAGSTALPRESSPGRPDRKSTRLNSSHLVISYAVFCLKKKIIQSLFYLSVKS